MPSCPRLFKSLGLNVIQDFSYSESSFNRFSEKLALRNEAFSYLWQWWYQNTENFRITQMYSPWRWSIHWILNFKNVQVEGQEVMRQAQLKSSVLRRGGTQRFGVWTENSSGPMFVSLTTQVSIFYIDSQFYNIQRTSYHKFLLFIF